MFYVETLQVATGQWVKCQQPKIHTKRSALQTAWNEAVIYKASKRVVHADTKEVVETFMYQPLDAK